GRTIPVGRVRRLRPNPASGAPGAGPRANAAGTTARHGSGKLPRASRAGSVTAAGAWEDRGMGEVGTVMGWGYQGRAVEELTSTLKTWRAHTLVDVRLNPVSRKPGFSKRALARLC